MSSPNVRSTAVKRLMKEFAELQENPHSDVKAQPVEDNLFEWHFTVKGPTDSEFDGGLYHGRILFPTDYPLKPPDIIFLTPSGRFAVNTKICLSITTYHPNTWQPSWGIRTALQALSVFFSTSPLGAIGSLDCDVNERKRLAIKSKDWYCKLCEKKNCEFFINDDTENNKINDSNNDNNCSENNSNDSNNDNVNSNELRHRRNTNNNNEIDNDINNNMNNDGRNNEAVQESETNELQTVVVPMSSRDRILSILTVVLALGILILLYRKLMRRTQFQFVASSTSTDYDSNF